MFEIFQVHNPPVWEIIIQKKVQGKVEMALIVSQ